MSKALKRRLLSWYAPVEKSVEKSFLLPDAAAEDIAVRKGQLPLPFAAADEAYLPHTFRYPCGVSTCRICYPGRYN